MKTEQKIGEYVLEDQIGIGGVGEVWRAHHVRLNTQVAIKFVLPHLCRIDNIYQRFEQEATTMAKLKHPHIVGIHDYFPYEDNACLVMSYIAGGSLQDRLHKYAPLPIAETLRISRGILSALDFAHQGLTIHRDVKPSNILMTHDSHAYLVDFGIALVLGKTRITRHGNINGTPEYMSPEQINGEHLDHRTDVYSFGCVLYEMLTGRPPFGSTDDGTGEFTIMKRHIEMPPEPLQNSIPNVDEHIEKVVMKALAKNRDNRFSGCDQMANSLSASPFIDADTTFIDRKTSLEVKKQPSRGLKIAIGTLALTTIIAAGGWVYTFINSRRPENKSTVRSNEQPPKPTVEELLPAKRDLEIEIGPGLVPDKQMQQKLKNKIERQAAY